MSEYLSIFIILFILVAVAAIGTFVESYFKDIADKHCNCGCKGEDHEKEKSN